jgi:glutaconate CoA-transferase subunit B
MTMPTQIDRFGQVNISFIGTDPAKPKVQLLGVRGIPGNTINHPCSFFVPDHSPRVFVERVDMASGVGHDPRRWAPGVRQDFRDLRLVVTNLAVLDFRAPDHAMRVRSLHPGVSLEAGPEQTGFAIAVANDLPTTPEPTAEQLRLIRTILDPRDLRATVFK